ncbi:MAG: T9SS type A sorting domain-containing protein [Bacteroidetes bacterium]|nr:T9SS type A sorting domain-containing protein [Bacteroidota bacterium]
MDKFSINILNSQDIAKIEIIDNQGRLIEVRTEISSMNTFDIKNNSPGIYFLKLMNRDGTAVFRKVVKLK